MRSYFLDLTFYSSISLIGVILIGMIKPTWVIWWESVQNRKNVLKLYGSFIIVLMLIHVILLAL